MEKWFDNKVERERLMKYTQKRLKGNSIEIFFRMLSITNWLIIINLIVFVLVLVLSSIYGSEKITEIFALQANSFFAGKYWTVFTSMFTHFELWHFLANMISLFFIGNFLEKLIGRKRVFWLYIVSGIFAGLFYASFSYLFGSTEIGARIFGSPDVFAVGASGAIFALLGLLAVLTPYNKVYLIAGPLIALILQAVLQVIFSGASFLPIIDLFIYLYFLFSIFVMFSFNSRLMKLAIPIRMSFWVLPIVAILPLVIIGLFISLPIGNTAHFGGLLVGIIYGFYLKNKYKKKTAMIKKVFSS